MIAFLKYLNKEYFALTASIIGIFCICSFFAITVFQRIPRSMDENSMLFQAKLFAQGKLYYPAEPYSALINEQFIINADGKIFSKYPPGPAILYSIGILFGNVGLVNPLISSLSCLFIFLTVKNLFSRKIAWLTLAILASSPYFYPYGCTFFSQSLSLMLCSLCFYLLSQHMRAASLSKIVGIGLCISYLFLTRQLDAFCLFISVSFYISFYSKNNKVYNLYVLSVTSAIGVLAHFTYNYILSGHFGPSLISIWSGEFNIVSPKAANFFNNISIVSKEYLGYLINITIPSIEPDFIAPVGISVIILFVFGSLLHMPPIRNAFLLFIGLIVFLYAFHPTNGYPVYGSRYWYCAFGAFIIIAANFLKRIQILLPKATFLILFCCLILLQTKSLFIEMSTSKRLFDLFKAVQADIDRSCPGKSIVLLEQPRYLNIDGIKYFHPLDFLRNPLPLETRIIVNNVYNAQKLKMFFSDYNICKYNFRNGDLINRLPDFPL